MDRALVGLDLQVAVKTPVYKIATVNRQPELTLENAIWLAQPQPLSHTALVRVCNRQSADAIAPRMPAQLPLDMILLGSLHPAVAQMSGLYWVDATADASLSYDYLIVSDNNNVAQLNPDTMLTIIAQSGFSNIDASIALNLRFARRPRSRDRRSRSVRASRKYAAH
jgi:hypothetical protein